MTQLTVAGVAGYVVAILGPNGTAVLGFNWPWEIYVPVAILIAGIVSALIGAIAVRTAGIYTIMITLATAVASSTSRNRITGCSTAIPDFAAWRPRSSSASHGASGSFLLPLPCGRRAVVLRRRLCRPFDLRPGADGSRDNPRRARAVGHNVTMLRVAAFFFAGLIAGAAGVLYVWFNGRISPGTVSVSEVVSVLVIAVIGGLRHPIGPFLGAALYVILKTFAIDIVGADRFNTLIGAIFLIVVFISPDGVLGLWRRIAPALAQRPLREA